MKIQNEIVNAVAGEPADNAPHHRFTAERDRRLRAHLGERTQPCTEPGGEDERMSRHTAIGRPAGIGSTPEAVERSRAPPAMRTAHARTNTYIVKHSSAKAGNPK